MDTLEKYKPKNRLNRIFRDATIYFSVFKEVLLSMASAKELETITIPELRNTTVYIMSDAETAAYVRELSRDPELPESYFYSVKEAALPNGSRADIAISSAFSATADSVVEDEEVIQTLLQDPTKYPEITIRHKHSKDFPSLDDITAILMRLYIDQYDHNGRGDLLNGRYEEEINTPAESDEGGSSLTWEFRPSMTMKTQDRVAQFADIVNFINEENRRTNDAFLKHTADLFGFQPNDVFMQDMIHALVYSTYGEIQTGTMNGLAAKMQGNHVMEGLLALCDVMNVFPGNHDRGEPNPNSLPRSEQRNLFPEMINALGMLGIDLSITENQ